MRLFYKRHASEENGWGFGQLVPVFLLLLPVLLMAEGFSGTCLSSTYQVHHADLARNRVQKESLQSGK